jgi:hypothetical protein
VAGQWKVATDRLNTMSQTVADMHRSMGSCIAAAYHGHDYKLRVAVDVRGEMAELKEVVNQLLERHHMKRQAAAV